MDKLDIPQGTLDPRLLAILARASMHGCGISQRLTVLLAIGAVLEGA